MSHILRMAAAAAILVWAAAPGVARTLGDECDMKSIEKGLWCAKCDKLLDKADVKEGKHTCGEKALEVEVCVKKYYEGCHKGPQEKPYKC